MGLNSALTRSRRVVAYALRRSRGWVLLLAAGFCFLGAWAVSSPPQSAPDDDFQLASIWCAGQSPTTGMCAPSRVPYDEFGVIKRLVPADIGTAPCFRGHPGQSAGCLAKESTKLVAARTNSGLYPRPFFSVLHWFAGSDVGGSVLMMRLFNVMLALVVFGCALAVAERGLRAAAALTWGVALVPMGAFFIPSTNASSWAIIGIGSLPVFLLQFLRGRPGLRMWCAALGSVVALLLATSARSDAAAFGGVVVVACVLMTVLADGFAARRRLMVMAAVILWAAILFFQSHIATSVASGGMGSGFPGMQAPPTSALSGIELWLSNLYALPGLLAGSFGMSWGLGWLDTLMPPIVGVSGCAIAALVILRGLATGGRAARVTFTVVALALVVVPLQILQASHGFVGNLVQPRYLYPLVVVAIMVAISGGPVAGPAAFAFTRRQYVAIAVVVGLANAYALHTNIERYVSGLAQDGIDPGYRHAWWWAGSPASPLGLWLLGSLAGAAALGGLVALAARAQGVDLLPTGAGYHRVALRVAAYRAVSSQRRRGGPHAHLMFVPSIHDVAPEPLSDDTIKIARVPVDADEADADQPTESADGQRIVKRPEPRRAGGSPRLGAPVKGDGRRRRD